MHADLVEPVTVKLLQGPKVGTGHKLAGRCVSLNVQNLLVSVLVNNGLAKTGVAYKLCSVRNDALGWVRIPSSLNNRIRSPLRAPTSIRLGLER